MSGVRPRTTLLIVLAFVSCDGQKAWNQPADEPRGSVSRSGGSPSYEGVLDIVDCHRVHGWAWDMNAPDARVRVEIAADGRPIGTSVAKDYRPDLRPAGKGDGRHAFTFKVPVTLLDSENHLISVRVAGSNLPLARSPQPMRCGFTFPETAKTR